MVLLVARLVQLVPAAVPFKSEVGVTHSFVEFSPGRRFASPDVHTTSLKKQE